MTGYPGHANVDVGVANRRPLFHNADMDNDSDGFEQSARIVEAFAEGETDPEVLTLLGKVAAAIRDHAIND